MNERYFTDMGVEPLCARYLEVMERTNARSEVPLPTFLCLSIASQFLKKSFFRGQYITLGDYISVLGSIGDTGALIGRRSDCELDQLQNLSLANPDSDEKVDWQIVESVLEEYWTIHRDVSEDDPISFSELTLNAAYIQVDVRYPNRPRFLYRVLEDKLRTSEEGFFDKFVASSVREFNVGIAFALNHPDLYSKMMSSLDSVKQNVQGHGSYEFVSQDVVNASQLWMCRLWAQLCRPETEHLFA